MARIDTLREESALSQVIWAVALIALVGGPAAFFLLPDGVSRVESLAYIFLLLVTFAAGMFLAIWYLESYALYVFGWICLVATGLLDIWVAASQSKGWSMAAHLLFVLCFVKVWFGNVVTFRRR